MRNKMGKVAKMTNPENGEQMGGLTMSTAIKARASVRKTLSEAERNYLKSGLKQPGGKLPLFDRRGQEIPAALIQSCINKGYAQRWFANPLKPDWLVCRLTDKGREAL